MTTLPSELNAASLVALIDQDVYPREVLLTIAQGFLPLPQEELVAVLAHLGAHADGDVCAAARKSIAELPSRTVLGFAADESANPQQLLELARATFDMPVLEALIRNRALPDEAVVELARTAEPVLQEVIVINQARILRTPQILDALLANPAVSADARRRALETREEFFDKKARIEALPPDLPIEPELADAPLDAIADLLVRAEDPNLADAASQSAPAAPPPDAADDKSKAIWARLQFMTVSQKVQLAFKGDKTVRMLLVRERNKLVCTATMRNPRMTEQEAEAIAGMRNVDDEVLRILSTRRDWISKYKIMVTLCRNPKAPVGVVLPLVPRLALRDLKFLRDDRNVPEVVRTTAKRIYLSRTQKTSS
jgi:hypothetical protein